NREHRVRSHHSPVPRRCRALGRTLAKAAPDPHSPKAARFRAHRDPKLEEAWVIDKNTASFMRSLCMGQIEEDIILPFPELSSAEKETLHGVIGSLGQLLGSREADFRKWDRQGELPAEFVDELRQFGVFGL